MTSPTIPLPTSSIKTTSLLPCTRPTQMPTSRLKPYSHPTPCSQHLPVSPPKGKLLHRLPHAHRNLVTIEKDCGCTPIPRLSRSRQDHSDRLLFRGLSTPPVMSRSRSVTELFNIPSLMRALGICMTIQPHYSPSHQVGSWNSVRADDQRPQGQAETSTNPEYP